jgi:hypothetical protein
MLLISDGNDWTKNNETVEYPFAHHVYELYGKGSNVELAHFANEGHDYGTNKRSAAYKFLAAHLGLDLARITDAKGQISEEFVELQSQKDLSYFTTDELDKLVKGDDVYKIFLASKKANGSK